MHLLESLFDKVAGLKVSNFIKKRLQHRFCDNKKLSFCDIIKSTFCGIKILNFHDIKKKIVFVTLEIPLFVTLRQLVFAKSESSVFATLNSQFCDIKKFSFCDIKKVVPCDIKMFGFCWMICRLFNVTLSFCAWGRRNSKKVFIKGANKSHMYSYLHIACNFFLAWKNTLLSLTQSGRRLK